MLADYGHIPDKDTEYECPDCGNIHVTYFKPDWRVPDTLKCGQCGCRFDWRTGDITGHKDRPYEKRRRYRRR